MPSAKDKSKSAPAIPADPWLEGVKPGMCMARVGRLHLQARLATIGHWLPLAATRWREEPEYVHQLRVSTRRATAAMRIFGDLLPSKRQTEIRRQLRRIRRAACDARDLDVLIGRFERLKGDAPQRLAKRLTRRLRKKRNAAQAPLQTLNGTLSDDLRNILHPEDLLRPLACDTSHGPSSQPFDAVAHACLKDAVTSFKKAARADLADIAALHALRLAGKKLRYTIEIAAPVCDDRLRTTAYPRLQFLQEFLGTINDHAQFSERLRIWRSESSSKRMRAALQGMILAEQLALADLHSLFLAWWKKKIAKGIVRYAACPSI